MKVQEKNHTMFIKSAFCEKGSFINTNEVLDWIAEQNRKIKVNIKRVSFKDLDGWHFDNVKIRHESSKFFTIDGITVTTNWGNINEWDQPIITQNEVGYLGFITCEFDSVLHFLVQAKVEPGNVNHVQLSPTLQATKSNYNQIHKGKKPLYLDYFINAKSEQILLDQLQSEQGSRFLRKRNRNIIIKVDNDIPVYDNFIWLTLAQIKKLMKYDNVVNMDTRTVISGITYGNYTELDNSFLQDNELAIFPEKERLLFLKSAILTSGQLNTIEEIITMLTHIKSNYDVDITPIPLNKMRNWCIGENEIYQKDGKYFKIIAVDVEINNREVVKWCQPMVESAQDGICAFVCKEINGIIHFAAQTKMECGNKDIVEFAPTVQCLTGNYRLTKDGSLPFLDYVLNADKNNIIFDTMQSEEGGRFFREQNRNLIIIAGDEIPVQLPEKYIWMTLNQLLFFLKFNNYVNIQARSLISAISFS